jgi:hypothetical protein
MVVNQVSKLFRNKGNFSGIGPTVNVIEAQVQKFKFTSNSTLRFTGWPENGSIGKSYQIRLHLCGSGPNDYRIIFATDGQGSFKYAGDGAPFPSPFLVSASGAEKVIDVWSYDSGLTVFIKYLGEFI